MNKRLLQLLIAGALVVPTASALAATTKTASFTASATVLTTCSVTAGNLAFGDIDPLTLATTPVDATSTIDVTCTNGTAYDVGLDAGTTGATVDARQMTDGSTNTLDYSLFSDSTRSTNWGDTIDTDTVAGTGNGTAQTLTVYGRVPSGQNTVKAGAYTDTVTVTLTY